MMVSSVRCTMSLVLSWVRPISSEIFLTISFLVTLASSKKAWSAHGARRVAQMYLQLGLMSRKNTSLVTPTSISRGLRGVAVGFSSGDRGLFA